MESRTVQYSAVQCSTVQYSTVQYSTVQYSTVQCSTVQYSTVQYSSTIDHFEGYLDILVQIGSIVTQGEEYSQQHLLGIRQFDNWPTDE